MAKLRVCSVYDSKAETFNNPFYVVALGVASRNFMDSFKGEGASMAPHRGDFILYHVADFDSNDGSFVSVIPPAMIMKGAEVEVDNGKG